MRWWSGAAASTTVLVVALTACTTAPPVAPAPTRSAAAVRPTASVEASTIASQRPPVMAASAPVRVEIPAIGVDSELMRLGLQDDGTMEVPPAGFPAGWYDGAPTPGELGPAVIAGHVDWTTGPGVFYDLAQVSVGDEVRVSRADGTTPVFAVTAVEEHPKDEFPTAAVYGDLDHAGLRLITCGGDWDGSVRHYTANVVVFAELVRPG
ncbi:class F sortase [Cellulomonas xiejunii]|uniref:Class F sortase n=1 Tax=Cellulomonas xiejunii TaxID=2968083 RepID=A0ABY5KRR2_9CELL|nr:class F sortase [Cellulomonas xiejunii]MCC2315309.1 class F sortase [Cellulomonas xiejunii]MCC2321886.1 class F sortase [Cellulomonas xiejunii]UUI73187.1 class F sortase [Cellulomonas xiejunii]